MTPSAPRGGSRVSIEVPAWVANLTDRGVRAGIALALVALAGLALIALAWSGVAARIYVPIQLPFVISGAFAGIALAGTSLALLAVHLERRAAATDRLALEQGIRTLAEVADRPPPTRRPPAATSGRLRANTATRRAR